jgi:PAS domain S-box-containing protein
MFAALPPEVLAKVALTAGLLGLAVVAWGAPRRLAPAVLALWAGFASLVASGVLGLGLVDDLDGAWPAGFLLAALTSLGVAGALAVLEFRHRSRESILASSETESLRREVARLTGISVRLEDEVRDYRRERAGGAAAGHGRSAADATLSRQRIALDAATEALRRHRAMFDAAVEGMALLERETLRVAEANPALLRMSGRTAEELGLMSLTEIFADGPTRPGRADLQRCAREARPLAATVARADGHAVAVELTIAAIGSGNEARLLAVVRDATDRSTAQRDAERALHDLHDRALRAEEALHVLEERNGNLESANRRLAELNERKDQHLSAVAHELRTPLTSIRSFSEILLGHEDTEPDVRREFLSIVRKESERLTRLVNNLLDLARIEAGAAKLAPSEFDPRSVLEDAAAAVRGMAGECGVGVAVRAGRTARVLRADRDRVQQVLVNLAANAVKASPAGAEVEMILAEGPADGPVVFEVRDRGRGISAEHQARIFDRFHRVEDAEGRGGVGTGLGLALCREIADLHGGTIAVESELGTGSVFRVSLPGLDEARKRPLSRPAGDAAATDRTVARPADAAPPAAAPRADDGTPAVIVLPRPSTEPAGDAAGVLPPLPRQEPPPPETKQRKRRSRDPFDLMSTTGSLPPLPGS